MSSELLVSAGALLGVSVTLGGLVVRGRLRDTGIDEAIAFEQLLADVDEAIAYVRGDGTVAFANAAFRDLVGTDPEGRPVEAALEEVPKLRRLVVDGSEGIGAVESGPEVSYHEVSLYATGEESDGLLVLCHDVTDHRERCRRLEERNERLDRFASIVSHDLRNPLDVALGRTNLIAETTDDPAVETHAEGIRDALDRMESIVDSVLVLARQGEVIGEKSTTALGELGEECWRRVETGQATLRVETDAVVEADTEGLTRIFENLFRNAVEHGSTSPDSHARQDREARSASSSRTSSDDAVEHAGPDVTVRVGSLPDGDGFYVADDGPGIPADERETVCQPGETGDGCGTGLGLAIVERIGEAHGWTFDVVESESGGARFEFSGVEMTAENVASAEQ